jgi:hypothetical protein
LAWRESLYFMGLRNVYNDLRGGFGIRRLTQASLLGLITFIPLGSAITTGSLAGLQRERVFIDAWMVLVTVGYSFEWDPLRIDPTLLTLGGSSAARSSSPHGCSVLLDLC